MNYYYVSYESIKGGPNDVGSTIHGKMLIKASNYAESQDKFFDWLKQQPFYPNLQRLFFAIEEVTDPIID